ncbi:hypothetical protein BN1058_00657 [Paraliobacillus sp. PM-2]|uniref:DUF6470 family protein n=1 Tax=Paraliobacillus sp. PM-2 TaxID=1462524 RepID=UPI00061C1343|nr:DUF6470 family protein [Paraliobacillus sp. PM-2]CQR46399.1 hypothetical protein BN1058_00657 [Paraliobacillus sp. PM-2]
MRFPQIRLQSQAAQLAIKQTAAQQTIRQPKAEQTIQQPKAKLNIETKPSKLTIDQSEAWADLGFKSVRRVTAEAFQQGKEAAMEATARRIRQGEEMMKIENGGNPIASQAIENGFDQMKRFNIGWIPSSGSVKVNYRPAEVVIDIQAQKPIIETKTKDPMTTYEPGKVDVTLAQKNNLQIDFDALTYRGIGGFEIQI